MTDEGAVQDYLDGPTHPRHDQILRLRKAILASSPGFTESVKWNAPSFSYRGADRATFRLKPRGHGQHAGHVGRGRRQPERVTRRRRAPRSVR